MAAKSLVYLVDEYRRKEADLLSVDSEGGFDELIREQAEGIPKEYRQEFVDFCKDGPGYNLSETITKLIVLS